MSTHTPGPWVAVAPGADWLVRASDGRSFVVGDAIYHPENGANARLIAAAPDLLRGLKYYVEHAELYSGYDEAEVRAADAAIAKAEGR